jgi:MerR family mercuric resistance operon transcriptional regulator
MQVTRNSAPEGVALSIGRIAEQTGTSPDTIRYYERIGLLPRASRSDGRHRCFAEAHVRHLLFIRRARALGFGLDAIGSLLSLAEPGRRSCASVRAIATEHLNDVRMRLAELRSLERALAKTVSQCTGDAVPVCAVLSILEAPAPTNV